MGTCGFLLLLAQTLCLTICCFILGAFGPPHTNIRHNDFTPCIVRPTNAPPQMIDSINCDQLGAHLVEMDPQKLQAYPLKSITHYVHIPNEKRGVRMNRWYQFMTVFMDIRFTKEFVEKVIEHDAAVISFNITIGYKDTSSFKKGKWSILAEGHVSRVMTCTHNDWDYPSCSHIQLFELGSISHPYYLINVKFESFALQKVIPEHSGLGPVNEVNMLEIHQSGGFTLILMSIKSFFLLLTGFVYMMYRRRMVASGHQPTLIERTLNMLALSLILLNIPFEYLKLWFDLPWTVVLADFRQGLFLCAMATFWAVFVAEHRSYDNMSEASGSRGLSCHWKQLAIVFIGCFIVFTYEFCERGIQVILPFYSLWSTREGQQLAWAMVAIALLCAIIYYIVLLAQAVMVVTTFCRKQKNIEALSDTAKKRYSEVFFIFKCQLLMTLLTAILCGATFLPSEMLLHEWQAVTDQEYSFYSGMITGNYGLWNMYVISTLILYLPQSPGIVTGSSEGPAEVQQLMTKTALE